MGSSSMTRIVWRVGIHIKNWCPTSLREEAQELRNKLLMFRFRKFQENQPDAGDARPYDRASSQPDIFPPGCADGRQRSPR